MDVQILSARQQRFRSRFGPVAVITGASSGIGLSIARQLAEAGFHLVLVARREELLGSLASELAQRHGTKTTILSVDLARPEAVDAVDKATAGMDVGLLVCSAGFGTSGPLIENDLVTELEMVEVNCKALLALTHIFARRFVAARRGGIVLLSSLVGFQGVPRAANYAATKAYVQSLAEGLHHELRPFGVSVLASAPGPVRSGFDARANMNTSKAEDPDVVARGTLAALGSRITARPGLLSKLLEWSLKTLPRRGRVRMLALVMAKRTARTAPSSNVRA